MAQQVCVASVPASHPYVERVLASAEIRVLPDPHPVGAPPSVWWPPVTLTPGWIDSHSDDAELLHLHFGLESFTTDDLIEAVDSAHREGWPVVQTVHDLENPQLIDQEVHRRQLDALLPIVDAVITLTPGAADEIERHWRIRAIVLPHPRLLPDGLEPPTGFARDVPVVGVHLKDLRPNVDGPGAVRALLNALAILRTHGRLVTAEVHLHRHVRDTAQRDLVRDLCSGRDDVVLLEHDRYDDVALANTLSHLDVCLLPYRSGTHSGWLELCWDLGVAVAAPDVGYFGQQHDDPTVASFSWSDDGVSLSTSIALLLESAPSSGSPERRRLSRTRLDARAEQDAATVAAHVALYRQLLATRSTSAGGGDS